MSKIVFSFIKKYLIILLKVEIIFFKISWEKDIKYKILFYILLRHYEIKKSCKFIFVQQMQHLNFAIFANFHKSLYNILSHKIEN